MEIKEYTISTHLQDLLQKAFEPYLEIKQPVKQPVIQSPQDTESRLKGWPTAGAGSLPLPLKDWLKSRQLVPLTPSIALQLAHKLETVLALDGGKEGLELLESLDGVMHRGGPPAFIIHGLPTTTDDNPDVSLLLHEAFRQLMVPHCAKNFQPGMKFTDEYNAGVAGDFTRDSVSVFHQDGNDYSMIAGINGGANPRHTVLMGVEEFIQHLVNISNQRGISNEKLRDDFRELLKSPIWSLTEENKNGKHVIAHVPFIKPNKAFHKKEPQSQPYEFNSLSLRNMLETVITPRSKAKRSLEILKSALKELQENDVDLREGPVLLGGDLLIFNDRLLIHAGGPHIHSHVQHGSADSPARTIIAYDIDGHKDLPYGVYPSDRVTKPILIDRLGVSLNQASSRI